MFNSLKKIGASAASTTKDAAAGMAGDVAG